jgi:hypothetical protein
MSSSKKIDEFIALLQPDFRLQMKELAQRIRENWGRKPIDSSILQEPIDNSILQSDFCSFSCGLCNAEIRIPKGYDKIPDLCKDCQRIDLTELLKAIIYPLFSS